MIFPLFSKISILNFFLSMCWQWLDSIDDGDHKFGQNCRGHCCTLSQLTTQSKCQTVKQCTYTDGLLPQKHQKESVLSISVVRMGTFSTNQVYSIWLRTCLQGASEFFWSHTGGLQLLINFTPEVANLPYSRSSSLQCIAEHTFVYRNDATDNWQTQTWNSVSIN